MKETRATTKQDGSFEVSLPAQKDQFAFLRIDRDQRARMQGSWKDLETARKIELGDVKLRRAQRLTARVVDESGKPVAKAEVELMGQWPEEQGQPIREAWSHDAVSAADGSLRFESCVTPGTWEVSVENATPLLRPKQFIVREGERLPALDIVVRNPDPSDAITGIVIDEQGRPVEAEVRTESGILYDTAAKTGPSGMFTIFRAEEQSRSADVKLEARAEGFGDFKSKTRYAWGTSGIELTLTRLPGLVIDVVEEGTGRPVEEYSVRCFRCFGDGWMNTFARKRFAGRHKSGTLTITDVQAGRHMVVVHPKSARLLPSLPILFEVPKGTRTSQRVEVRGPTEYPVKVVYGDGKPVAGTKVDLLLSPHQGQMWQYTKVRDLEGAFDDGTISFGAYSSDWAFRVAEATTDDSGNAVLRWQPSRMKLTVRALGPGHTPAEQEVVLSSAATPIKFVVGRDARIIGTLGPERILRKLAEPRGAWAEEIRKLVEGGGNQEELDRVHKQLWPGLVLKEVGGGARSLPGGFRDPYAIGLDGSFAIDKIPPGTWQVFLRKVRFSLDGRRMDRIHVHPPLATMVLSAGETEQLTLSLTGKVEPGTLTIAVLLNGKPLPGAVLYLETGNPDGRGGVEFEGAGPVPKADANGVVTLAPLDPMYYRAQVYLRDRARNEDVKLPGFDWVRLAPRTRLDRVIHLTTARIRMRVLSADGKTPVRNRVFDLSDAEGTTETKAKTDDDGWITLDPAPVSPFHLDTWPEDFKQDPDELRLREREQRRIRLGPVQVPAGKSEASFELRMPPGKK